jgi:hypothetical protein
MNSVDLISLPLRAAALFILIALAYYFGYGTLHKDWCQDSPETGTMVRYTRNGRPWRTFCDLDRDGKWDKWIDERAGPPRIVSFDDNGDGKADREEDEMGRPLSTQQTAKLRFHKTLAEFLHNPTQLVYSVLAILVYGFSEFWIRWLVRRKVIPKG